MEAPTELTEYAALPVVSEEVDAVGRVVPEGGPAGAELGRVIANTKPLLPVVIHGQSIGRRSNWILHRHANWRRKREWGEEARGDFRVSGEWKGRVVFRNF